MAFSRTIHEIQTHTQSAQILTPADHTSTPPASQQTAAERKDATRLRKAASKAIHDAHREYDKATAAAALNKTRQGTRFKVGDFVAVYYPPDATKSRRAKKHLYQWQGPCRVETVLDSNIYAVRHVHTQRTFTRSIVNLRPWTTPINASLFQKALAADPHPPRVGEIVAARDDEDPTSTTWQLSRRKKKT